MEKTTMDEFNEKDVSTPNTNKTTSVTWQENIEAEAVCAVCDALFTPLENRPPIFCANCKAALKFSINK